MRTGDLAVLYHPNGYYPVVVLQHPLAGTKDQTAVRYSRGKPFAVYTACLKPFAPLWDEDEG